MMSDQEAFQGQLSDLAVLVSGFGSHADLSKMANVVAEVREAGCMRAFHPSVLGASACYDGHMPSW